MDLPHLILLVPSPPHPLQIFSELVYFPLKQTNNQNKDDKQNKQAKKTKTTTKSIKPYLKNYPPWLTILSPLIVIQVVELVRDIVQFFSSTFSGFDIIS